MLQQAMPGWPIERCPALPEAPKSAFGSTPTATGRRLPRCPKVPCWTLMSALPVASSPIWPGPSCIATLSWWACTVARWSSTGSW